MLYLKHGGHMLHDSAKDAEKGATTGDAFLAKGALPSGEWDKLRQTETPFDYLLASSRLGRARTCPAIRRPWSRR